MTDVDEQLLTAAKLREQVRGGLDGDDRLLDHTGLVDTDEHRQVLSFCDDAVANWSDSSLSESVVSTLMTDSVTRAVVENNPSLLAFAVGVTEQDMEASQLSILARLNSEITNNDAPAFVTLAGNPNTGKTNTASLLVELRREFVEDLLVISNVRTWDLTDVVVTSAHDLAVSLLEYRDRPKAILLDEASTAFDARTHRHEVATQYTPLAKRYAKIGVDLEVAICHTGKDLHPERKRLTSLAAFKTDQKTAELYERWPADSESPADRLFTGDLEGIEPTSVDYEPDDAAPWSWDLDPDLFTLDVEWSELLEELRSRGPAD